MIDKATVAKIKDRADIVEVVSDYVHLTRRGANYMGLCPFHNEKTPSFSVSPRRNFCYCFSCHKGGSPVNFIMEKEGVSYHDALIRLADKYGIKVEERELTEEERKTSTEREGLMIAAQRAMQIMEKDLTDTPEGRDVGLTYLYGRGITEEAVKKFHLGYALDEWQHISEIMRKEGYDTEILRALGISGISKNGNLYDKYKGRVIFPILNSTGKPVGFGGRDLKGDAAKYINSPESILYHKNQELYGIFQAKSEIVRQDRCYLVEGYMDVISMWQSGIQNVVASSGTALTDGQIALIHRFTDKITLLYDGDKAGIKAALRGIDMLLSHKMEVSVLLLPDGDDPDSFAKKHSPEEFRDYIKTHETDIIRFKMQILLAEMGNSAQERARVINDVSRSIACIPNDVQRTVYIGECSRLLKIDEGTVAKTVESARLEILERMRTDRLREAAERDYPVAEPQKKDYVARERDSIQQSSDNIREESLAKKIEAGEVRKSHPLLPLEKAIIEYLVRFGYVPVQLDDLLPAESDINSDSNSELDNVEVLYTVTDLVKDEMESNSLSFSYPPHERLFKLLLNHLDEFVDLLDKHKSDVDAEILKLRERGIRDIASRATTLQDIEKEEKFLDQSLAHRREEMILEFSKNYPGVFLTSHEDGEIRAIATELYNERYILSKLFTKVSDENAVQDIAKKVMRGLREWQSELLTLHLQEIQEKLRENDGKDDELERTLMKQQAAIMYERSKLAKNCGERIVASR